MTVSEEPDIEESATLPALSSAMNSVRAHHKPSTERGGRPSSMRLLTIPIKSPPALLA